MLLAQEKKYKLINGSIAKQLIIFALPILLTSLLQQLYHITDGIIVGKYVSTEALTGINQSSKVINVLVSLFLGISVGGGVIIAQYFGAKDNKNLSKAVHNALIISIVFGLVVMLIGYIFSPSLLRLMKVDVQKHMDYALSYLRIYFLGVVFLFVFNMCSGILRAVGDSISPLIFLGGSAFLNIILDYYFVANLNLGIKGAGWATLICQALTSIAVVIRLMFSKHEYKVKLKNLRFDSAITKKIVSIGIPTGLQNSIISGAHVFMAYFINSFEPVVADGVALYSHIDGFVYLPLTCFALALSTFVGQNVGAGKYTRAKKSLFICILLSECVTIFVCIIMYILAKPIMQMMGGGEEAIKYGMIFATVLALSYPILAINDALAGALRGAGRASVPAIVLIIGMCGLRVVFILIGMAIHKHIIVVVLSYPVSWIFTTITLALYHYKSRAILKPDVIVNN